MNAPEPTPDQLLVMAYADGELNAAQSSALELRLAHEPELARELAELRRLELLARSAAPPELQDHERRRLGRDPLQRGLGALGWGGLLAGAAAGLFAALHALVGGQPQLSLRLCAAGLLLGLSALLVQAWHARVRSRPFDPYTEIER